MSGELIGGISFFFFLKTGGLYELDVCSRGDNSRQQSLRLSPGGGKKKKLCVCLEVLVVLV